jgi:hypothetical protein
LRDGSVRALASRRPELSLQRLASELVERQAEAHAGAQTPML